MPWGHTLHSLQLRCATSLSMRSLSSPRFSKHGKHNHRFSSGDASCALSFVHLRGNGCSEGVSVLPVADVVLPTFVHDVSAPDVVLQSLSIARLYLLLHSRIVWTMLVKLQVAF